jgi:predicted RNA methylase
MATGVREAGLDQFYTIPAIAERCIQHVGNRYRWSNWGLVVEPSAGNGSFLTRIPTEKRIGMDLSPQHPDIIQQDFFEYTPPRMDEPILVIGNPPFGKVSSLAIRFFQHAAAWADVIAFIVPRTFRRISVHNKLPRSLHLVWDEDIPLEPCSFEPPMAAKCCFQIWERKIHARPFITLPTTHPDWEFMKLGPCLSADGPKDAHGQPTPPIGADFAIRAYGGACGEIVETGLENLRPKSWHWISARIDRTILRGRFHSLNYTVSQDTARQNSIGKGELVRLYSDAFSHGALVGPVEKSTKK